MLYTSCSVFRSVYLPTYFINAMLSSERVEQRQCIKGNFFLKREMSAVSGRRAKAHKKKKDKHHISHFKLLFQTALCGTHIFPVCFSDNALCILLDTAGTWDLYFRICESQNGLFI